MPETIPNGKVMFQLWITVHTYFSKPRVFFSNSRNGAKKRNPNIFFKKIPSSTVNNKTYSFCLTVLAFLYSCC